VHDLSQLHVPGKYDAVRMFYATRVLPALIGRQDRVVTVSGSTRADVLERTSLPAERVSVVPNGVDIARYSACSSRAAPQVSARLGLDRPYLLYVARLEHPGKNHVALLEAYARLRLDGVRHKLVLAGPRWNGAEAIDAAVSRLGLADHVVFTGFVAGAESNLSEVQQAALEEEGRKVMAEQGIEVAYKFGTMIEIPRAALTADQLARCATASAAVARTQMASATRASSAPLLPRLSLDSVARLQGGFLCLRCERASLGQQVGRQLRDWLCGAQARWQGHIPCLRE
jgi:glycosyltransferase involved in cell wall biosynthesis